MKIVFVTHNELGRRCILALDGLGANVAAVYTSPESEQLSDQISFRSLADNIGTQLHEVTSINTPEVAAEMREYNPDILFVVGWSRLVEQEIIDIPYIAALGMHPAPLPRGRGRAPVAWNLIKGYESTELTMFQLVEEADAGAVYGRYTIEIDEDDDAGTLNKKIYNAGESLIRKCYPQIVEGSIEPQQQDEAVATWWPRRRPHDGLIDWNHSARDVYNWIRGQTHPYPGAFTYIDETKVTIWEAEPPEGNRVYAKPGEILDSQGSILKVAAWEEAIEIRRLQVSDDNEIPAAHLVTAYPYEIGDVFEPARDHLMQETDKS
jgi:methionyl-tRNA formyltransferase